MSKEEEEELEYKAPPEILISYVTEDTGEYFDGGIQETGERLILCKDGRSGFEVDPKITLNNGKLVWP